MGAVDKVCARSYCMGMKTVTAETVLKGNIILRMGVRCEVIKTEREAHPILGMEVIKITHRNPENHKQTASASFVPRHNIDVVE